MNQCKNCKLFDKSSGSCRVVVMVEGEKYELPVRANDECHWERIDREVNAEIKQEFGRHRNVYFQARMQEELAPMQIKQIRVYSDGKDGFIEES